jgi:serine/threonine-protein kinase RsbW
MDKMIHTMDESPSLRITADLKDLATIRRFVEQASYRPDANSEVIDDMVIALNEAVTNIIVHGYQNRPGIIEVEVTYDNDSLVVYLRDEAPPFDPTAITAPDFPPSLEQPLFGGMGIQMMSKLTTVMTYRTLPKGGNELTLIRKGG